MKTLGITIHGYHESNRRNKYLFAFAGKTSFRKFCFVVTVGFEMPFHAKIKNEICIGVSFKMIFFSRRFPVSMALGEVVHVAFGKIRDFIV